MPKKASKKSVKRVIVDNWNDFDLPNFSWIRDHLSLKDNDSENLGQIVNSYVEGKLLPKIEKAIGMFLHEQMQELTRSALFWIADGKFYVTLSGVAKNGGEGAALMKIDLPDTVLDEVDSVLQQWPDDEPKALKDLESMRAQLASALKSVDLGLEYIKTGDGKKYDAYFKAARRKGPSQT